MDYGSVGGVLGSLAGSTMRQQAQMQQAPQPPTHLVKYIAVSNGPEKIAEPQQERAFGSAEDAEAFAKSLVVGCSAHPESIRIYAETGCRVVVGMEYLPSAPPVAPRPSR